jgi:RNA polymerase sigma-70 factor (ECF subfamily)
MDNTDRNLIDAHCQGSKTAFTELVRRYGEGLFGYLIRMSGNRDQAEDLVQETFKRVHEKAHTFRGTQLKNWLFTIATRVAIDSLRKRKRIRLVSLNQQADCADEACEQLETLAVADNSCEPSQEVVLTEQKEQVRQAIESLPARQRATLVLAYYQELSYREVAEVLGCSIGTVKAQMSRALRTLAQRLPDTAGDIK